MAAEAAPVDVFGVSFEVVVGASTNLFRHSDNGTLSAQWDIPESRFASSLATDGVSLFVGQYDGGGAFSEAINRYRFDGALLGAFADVSDMAGPSPNFAVLETDATGNIYVAFTGQGSQPRTSFRLDPAGAVAALFSHPDLVFPQGIDAFANGTVYIVNSSGVGVGNRLFQFAADGAYVADYAIPDAENPADIAINEMSEELYLADEFSKAVRVYDLSSGAPVFSDSLALPSYAKDVFVEPLSGRIFGTYYETVTDGMGLFLKYSTYEVTRDGVVSTFEAVDADARRQTVQSVAAVAVPEPAGIEPFLLAGMAMASTSIGRPTRNAQGAATPLR